MVRKKKPGYSVPALENGLDILELLASQEQGLAQARIAQTLGRTSGEIFRLLDCLARRGYIRRGKPEGLYRLSSRMFTMSHQHPPMHRLHEKAMPLMRSLAREIRQSCHLSIYDDGNVLVIAQADAPGHISYAIPPGTRVPVQQTGSGVLLLAYQDEVTRKAWLSASPRRVSRAERAEIQKQIAAVRRRGYLRRPSRFVRSMTDLSAPVFDHTGAPVAAMTVPYLEHRERMRAVTQTSALLVAAAGQLSESLGAPGHFRKP